MSKQSELNSYIMQLLGRLRLRAWLLGGAVLTSTALLTTITLVLILKHYAFPTTAIVGARLALLLALITAVGFGIIAPLLRLTPAFAVTKAEAMHPALDQRLKTFHERHQEGSNPFLELLAADTLARTQDAAPSSLASGHRLLALTGIGVGCLGTLLWMICLVPGSMGYGAALLWTGVRQNTTPPYSISVSPGDVTVRRNSDQLITARVVGLHPEKVQMFAHYQSTNIWEPVTMQTQPDQGGATNYQFVLAGLPESVEYYVKAGPLVSQHYKVRVVDLPSVKAIQVTYRYPQWTGLKSTIQKQAGDLRAIEGTDASIEVEMDKPLRDGKLALDNNKAIVLSGGEANKYKGTIHMDKDGAYHIAAIEQGESLRLSEDYFIATDKAEPPQINIVRPGGDYRASPIEEVKVGIEAAGQFGLNDVRLHYSVNGGPNQESNILKARGAKSTEGSHTFRLEEFNLVPGDLVSLYATAKDGHSEARTNISFIQVDPFEREFSQSQQGGGGGGGGGNGQNNQADLSKREKELIAATWRQQNEKASRPKDAEGTGQFLSDAQQKLRDQVLAISTRMQSRDLSEANEELSGFEKDMQVAAEAMAPSAEKLKGMHWQDALPFEQKALQALLRAEATFRKIQVAFGQQGGGGGGAGSAGRDLASLFDLELDTEKNQYETAQNTSPAEQQQKDIEDVLAKLDALAKRQEELSRQQQNPQQGFQQRWQQEMLRREAEQLQRQMEQLARNNGQGQQNKEAQSGQSTEGGSSSQNGSQQSRNSSSGNSSSQASGHLRDQRIEQALSRLRQAGDAMKRGSGSQENSESAQQASERLEEAKNLLGGVRQQLSSAKLGSLSQEADRLAQEERAQIDRINKFATRTGETNPVDRDSMMARSRERNQLAGERQQLSDDLSRLQTNIRDSARTMAPNQPGVAQKLREALTEMDQSDLDNHVQRTADWLRRGINPNSNGTESNIAQGLQKLSQQLRDAQKQMGQGNPGRESDPSSLDQTAALNQIRRLRGQLEAMAAKNGRPGSNPQRNQQGPTAERRNLQPGTQGQNPAQGSSNQGAQNEQQQQGGLGQQGNDRTGSTDSANGEIRTGGGGNDGVAWGNINTGGNSYAPGTRRPVPLDASGNPRDNEYTYEQQMRQLNQLGRMVRNDPNVSKEIRDLTRQMQTLDPRRFPGNPEIVEHMQQEMLDSIDRIELQLSRAGSATEARAGKPDAVPSGYEESVADYYRRLSKTH